MRRTHSPCHDPHDSEPLGNTRDQLSLSLSTLTSYTAVPRLGDESTSANQSPACDSVVQSEARTYLPQCGGGATGDLLLLISPDIDTHSVSPG